MTCPICLGTAAVACDGGFDTCPRGCGATRPRLTLVPLAPGPPAECWSALVAAVVMGETAQAHGSEAVTVVERRTVI